MTPKDLQRATRETLETVAKPPKPVKYKRRAGKKPNPNCAVPAGKRDARKAVPAFNKTAYMRNYMRKRRAKAQAGE